MEIVSSEGRVSSDDIRLTLVDGRKSQTERPCLASVVKCPEADRVCLLLVKGGRGLTLQFPEMLGVVTSLELDQPLELSLFIVVRCPRCTGLAPVRED